MKISFVLIQLGVCFYNGVVVCAETSQKLRPSQDANIFQGLDESAAGSGRYTVGYRNYTETGAILENRALVQFDLSSLPSDAQIVSAEILLDTYGRTREGEPDIQAHRITSFWTTEATSASGGGSIPANAITGDVTWKYSSYDSLTWNNPGGDFDSEVLSTESNDGREDHVFPSTPALVDTVQGWVDDIYPNYGFMLLDPEKPPTEEHFRLFFGVETGGRGGELLVTYTSESEPIAPPSPAPETRPPTGSGGGGGPTTGPPNPGCEGNAGLGGTVKTFIATKDAMILDGRPDEAAANDMLVLGKTSDGIRRVLYQFDFNGIPDDAKIICAEFDFMVIGDDTTKGTNQIIRMHRLTEGWTSDTTSSADGNNGSPAQPDDVTWTYRRYPSETWSDPGGSYDPTVLSEKLIDDEEDEINLETTSAMVSTLQGMLDGNLPNYGFILIGQEDATTDVSQVVIWPQDNPRNGRNPYVAIRYRSTTESISSFDVCFSARNTVQVQNVGTITMDKLRIGDYVKTDNGRFEPVYSFGHYSTTNKGRSQQQKNVFLQIHASGLTTPLELSDDHMVFILQDNNNQRRKAIAANKINVGDTLILVNDNNNNESDEDETTTVVTKITTISRYDGAFAPFTPSGTIVVNNILASNYVSLMNDDGDTTTPWWMQSVAHGAVWFRRLYCGNNGCLEETYDTKDGIADWVRIPLSVGKFIADKKNNSTIVTALLLIAAATTFTTKNMLIAMNSMNKLSD